jgi:hypothetical protein
MDKKKLLVISPMVALLCVAMFAGLANANPSYTFSIYASGAINGGYCGSPNNIVGTGTDNTWAQLYGSVAGRGAYIVADMSTGVSGSSYIGIYAKCAAGYTSSVLNVYTSSDGVNFYLAGATTVSTTSGTWYYFVAPSTPSPFYYIYISGVGGAPVSIFVDCVLTM